MYCNTRNLFICFILTVIFCNVWNLAGAVTESGQNQDVMKMRHWLQTLATGDWQAVDKLLASLPRNNERVNAALIARMEKETAYRREKRESGEYTRNEYYMDILHRVSMIENPMIIGPLADSLEFVGGNRIPGVLAKFGDASLRILTAAYRKTQDVDAKTRILFAIGRVLRKNTASSMNGQTKVLLLEGIKDESPFVRRSAIGALMALGDGSVVPRLKEIAEHDAYKIPRGADNDLWIYPIREAAQRAIHELAALPLS
ncbi:MAG: HEAT repeat domain-containing protein [Gammaproteobacteria bacterium]|nr:HEAT repeat domain-containing protein [Gammaproteobacteria bacterium]